MTTRLCKVFALAALMTVGVTESRAQLRPTQQQARIQVSCSHAGHAIELDKIVNRSVDQDNGYVYYDFPSPGSSGTFPDGTELWLSLAFRVDDNLFSPALIADLFDPRTRRTQSMDLLSQNGTGLVLRNGSFFDISSVVFESSTGYGLYCRIGIKEL